MKILIINGSPKKDSNTMVLTKKFMEGIESEEKHEVEIINVIEKNISYCRGCLSCWIRQDGYCFIDDDMNAVLDTISKSDMIIWSFPLYEYGIPGPLKTLIDRTNPFLKMQMYSSENRVFHETVVDIPAKKNVVICGCGFPYFEENFIPLRMQMKNILVNPSMICIFESGLVGVSEPQLEPLKNSLFDALEQAGREYIKAGKISEETLHLAEQPMLPNETYINIINGMVK